MGGPLHLDDYEYDEQRDRSNNASDRDGIAPCYITAPVKTKEESESCHNKTKRSKKVNSSELLPPVRVFDWGKL